MTQNISLSFIQSIIEPRKVDASKHDFGHAFLIAGSKGKMGAAVLSSRACLRSGCGLLTTHIPKRGEIILQTSVPEAMVFLDSNEDGWSELPSRLDYYNAVGVGPGIGQQLMTIPVMRLKTDSIVEGTAVNINTLHFEEMLNCDSGH